jgi:monoamine oxidase
MSRAKSPVSVGIVGAGFAGLRCADVLLQHAGGFKVTILEARNRLGGRVSQSWHLGHPVDLYVRIISF